MAGGRRLRRKREHADSNGHMQVQGLGGIGYPRTGLGLAHSGGGRHSECPGKKKQGRKMLSRDAGLGDPHRIPFFEES